MADMIRNPPSVASRDSAFREEGAGHAAAVLALIGGRGATGKVPPPGQPELDFAVRHEVLGYFLAGLRERDLVLPAGTAAPSSDFQKGVVAKNAALIRTACDLGARLAAAGIPYVFAKGLALWFNHGRANLGRFTRDLDIYVLEMDVDRSRAIMLAAGYSDAKQDFSVARRWLHHHSLLSPAPQVQVELHWAVAAPWHGIRLDLERCLRRSRQVEVGTVRLAIPSNADLLALTVADLSKDSWSSLKKIMDFAQLASLADADVVADCERVLADAGLLRSLEVSVLLCCSLGLLITDDGAPAARLRDGARRSSRDLAALAENRLVHPAPRGPVARVCGGLLFAAKHDRLRSRMRHVAVIICGLRVMRFFGIHRDLFPTRRRDPVTRFDVKTKRG